MTCGRVERCEAKETVTYLGDVCGVLHECGTSSRVDRVQVEAERMVDVQVAAAVGVFADTSHREPVLIHIVIGVECRILNAPRVVVK